MNKLLSRVVAGMGAVALAVSALGVAPAAAEFPTRPIKIVHGSNPGAPQDIMIRKLAEEVKAATGASVVVEPRPGGTSTVAVSHMLGQEHDGHTLFLGGSGVIRSLQKPSSPYKVTQLKPVYRIQLDPFTLYVKRGGKYDTTDDLVADMKKHPGKVRIGGFGSGSGQHFAAIEWTEATGTEMTWVPFNSGSKAITAVMGDNLDAALSNLGVYNRFNDKTKVLGMSAKERNPALPEVQTFVEQGLDVTPMHWRSLFAPKDTPKENVEAVYDIIHTGVKSPAFQEYLRKSGTIDGTMTVAEFQDWFESEYKKAYKQMKAYGFVE